MASPRVKKRSAAATSTKGLTKPGVVVIQSLLIGLFVIIELVFRQGVGVFTGVAIGVAVLGTIRFARQGTAYVAAATPPLAFAFVAFITILLQDGLRPSRVGVDFIASLASVAPYLLISVGYGWFNYFKSRR
ncbi:MAG: hypothetical protein HY050_00020 [Actinobacteria bacterium]|nr:hypothetical protein [Actinomycetota bacterium]